MEPWKYVGGEGKSPLFHIENSYLHGFHKK